MIKRIIGKISISYFAPLPFLASLREIKEVDLKEITNKIVIPAFVTLVKLRCDAPFRFLLSIQQRIATLALLLAMEQNRM